MTAIVLLPNGDVVQGRPQMDTTRPVVGSKITAETERSQRTRGPRKKGANGAPSKQQKDIDAPWEGRTRLQGGGFPHFDFFFYSFMRLHLPHFQKENQPFKVQSIGKKRASWGKGRLGDFITKEHWVGASTVVLFRVL